MCAIFQSKNALSRGVSNIMHCAQRILPRLSSTDHVDPESHVSQPSNMASTTSSADSVELEEDTPSSSTTAPSDHVVTGAESHHGAGADDTG